MEVYDNIMIEITEILCDIIEVRDISQPKKLINVILPPSDYQN